MRSRRGDEPETYHLTCPVCGALPGTSCIEEFQELERMHPSRRMSVAERNRRHAATGWEPPELAERRLGKCDTASVEAAPPAAGAGRESSRRQAAVPAPRREPEIATRPTRADAGSPGGEGTTWVIAGFSGLTPGADSRIWFAAYLSAFPRGATVPRRQLRGIANARWQGGEGIPLRLSPARQAERRMDSRSGSSTGRRSSQKLADHLKRFEDLGLIRRDSTRDAVVIADPAGLRQLANAQAEALGSPAP